MVSEQELRQRIKALKRQRDLRELEQRGKQGSQKLKQEFRQLKRESSKFKGIKRFSKVLGRGVLAGTRVIGKRIPKKKKKKVTVKKLVLKFEGKKPKVFKNVQLPTTKLQQLRQPIQQQVRVEPKLPTSPREKQIIRQQTKTQKDKETLNFLMNV